MKQLTCFAVLLTLLLHYNVTSAQSCSAAFTYAVGSGHLVTFYATDTTGTSRRWSFGDGSSVTSTANPITHTYAQPGQYPVIHYTERTGAVVCHDSSVQIITIPADSCHLAPRFEYRIDSVNCLKVYFLNYTTPLLPNTTYTWSFGDGGSSADGNPTHIYARAGTYYVYLISSSGAGCSKMYADTLHIGCTVPPADSCNTAPRFAYSRDSINCKTIHFLNHTANASAATHYSWNFGDSTSSTDANPVHTYKQNGIYYVCLVSETGSNCRKQYCDTIQSGCPPPPIDSCNFTASFQFRRDSINCNQIHFINTTNPVFASTHFYWSFGDSTTSADANPTHTYARAGIYHVCLVSEIGTGCERQYCDTVQAGCAPPPPPVDSCNFTASFQFYRDTFNCNELHFINHTNPVFASTHFNWSFGDGSSSTDANPTHVYAQKGHYTVCLTSEVGQGCEKHYCDSIQTGCDTVGTPKLPVHSCDSVVVKYTWSRNAERPNQIGFKAVGDSVASQVWTISKAGGNINTPITVLTQPNPTWTFTDTGWYRVCLVGVTAGQCRKEYCDSIHVEKIADGPRWVVSTPNPAVNTVTIEVTLDKPAQVMIRIVDGSGVVKEEFSENGATGNNRFTLPVERLSHGMYLVVIHSSTHQWYSRFQKG